MALDYNSRFATRAGTATQAEIDQGLRAYMLKVYNYMASGVALTGIIALLSSPTSSFGVLSPFFYSVAPNGGLQPNMLVWISMFATLGIVFFLSFRVGKMSAAAAQGTFWAYAALNGIWLSSIFLTYTDASIVRVFFISAAAFAGLSLFGYTTKKDLSGLGTFLTMGLIGILIASGVNIFLGSPMIYFVVSVAGVLIFAGLTAYDTQKIKDMYVEGEYHETAAKKAVMGALSLYLDFINLFIMLLRLFGERR